MANKDSTYEELNRILAEWNPIGVDDSIALDEYRGYVPSILRHIGSTNKLMDCLEDILVREIGVPYDPKNPRHVQDLRVVCEKLLKVSISTDS